MATTAAATTGTAYTHSDSADVTSGARKRICEDIIYSQDPRDLPMRDLFGGYEKLKVDSIKIEHVEDNHMPIEGAVGSVVTLWNNSTTSALPVADGDKYMVGDILLTKMEEILVVSDVDEAGNTIDVYARGDLQSTESDAHTAADKILIIGNAQLEEYTYGNDVRFMTRTAKINYTQIFHDTLSVSKSYEEVPKYGIKKETLHQLEMKLLRKSKLLERACLYSGISGNAAEGSASYPRTMCGIISQSSTASHPNIQTSTTDLASAEITEAALNTEMQEIYDAGGNPDTVMCNSFNKKVISDFMMPYRRAEMDDKKYGGVVSKFENDFGVVDLVLNRYMRQQDIVIMTKKDFSIGALRPFKVTDLPDTKDSYRKEIVGEYTCMLHNEEHNAWIYDTSTS